MFLKLYLEGFFIIIQEFNGFLRASLNDKDCVFERSDRTPKLIIPTVMEIILRKHNGIAFYEGFDYSCVFCPTKN